MKDVSWFLDIIEFKGPDPYVFISEVVTLSTNVVWPIFS